MPTHNAKNLVGIKSYTLYRRLNANWTPEETLTIPVSKYNKISEIRKTTK